MFEKNFYKIFLILLILTFVTIEFALYNIFIIAPLEEVMGVIQKIFYFHVASAWLSFFAFFIVFTASLLFLWKNIKMWDVIAWSSAEIGVIFCTIVLITGPIWARPIWNAWWTWDARLTTTLVLWMIYMTYLLIRPFSQSEVKGAKFAAVFGIIGFIDVPIVFMSIRWWRTIHPQVITKNSVDLDPVMFRTLMISIMGFTFLYFLLLILRVNSHLIKDEFENIKNRLKKF